MMRKKDIRNDDYEYDGLDLMTLWMASWGRSKNPISMLEQIILVHAYVSNHVFIQLNHGTCYDRYYSSIVVWNLWGLTVQGHSSAAEAMIQLVYLIVYLF